MRLARIAGEPLSTVRRRVGYWRTAAGLSRTMGDAMERVFSTNLLPLRGGTDNNLAHINIGWLLRRTEPHFNLVECFDSGTNTCPIAPACGLKGALYRAQGAFLSVLDEYSLEQLVTRRADLSLLLKGSLRRRAGADDATEEQE